jgi:4-hydroxy-tetrahydrodipicolinate reductase
MGNLVCQTVEADEALELVGRYDADDIDQLDEVAPAADLVIDFSRPEALPHVMAYVRRTGASLVCGTTGLTDDDLKGLQSLGEVARVVWSSNYSLGVAALRHLSASAAGMLEGWDIEIVETHHNQKADAPSGTAVALVEAVRSADSSIIHGREGMVGARPAGEIGVHAVRGGTVAGTHEVHFFGPDEELCLTHRATSRQIFAQGAVTAARRLLTREPGFYSFDELLFEE